MRSIVRGAMSPMIEVVNSTLDHVKSLSVSMRPEDQNEIKALGLSPYRSLYYSYKHAVYRKTALVNGSVAAMWGVGGVVLGLVGQPYLLTGTESDLVSPVRFSKIYRREVQIMKTFFPILENYVDAYHFKAIDMLRLAGFRISDVTFINGHLFRRFSL